MWHARRRHWLEAVFACFNTVSVPVLDWVYLCLCRKWRKQGERPKNVSRAVEDERNNFFAKKEEFFYTSPVQWWIQNPESPGTRPSSWSQRVLQQEAVQRHCWCYVPPWSKFGEHDPVENGEHNPPPGTMEHIYICQPCKPLTCDSLRDVAQIEIWHKSMQTRPTLDLQGQRLQLGKLGIAHP